MTTHRRLVRFLRRLASLVASDEALWAEVRALVEDFRPDPLESKPTSPEPIGSATETQSESVYLDPSDLDPLRSSSTADIAARCRLKAVGCRWAAERLRLKSDGANHRSEIAPRDSEIIERAKALPGCRLWMNSPSAPVPDDLTIYDTLAESFDSLAATLYIANSSQEVLAADKHLFGDLLRLTAEAQSAVRTAVRQVAGPTDQDQVEAFWFVKTTTANLRIYINRHMRDDDPADPTEWADLRHRIERFAETVELRAAAHRRQRRVLQKLRYQMEQAASGDDHTLWEAVARTLDEVVQDGIPPSNLEVRGLLLPHIEIIPQLDRPPKGFELVLRETRRFRESLVDDPVEVKTAESLPVIEAAAEMVEGRAVLLIGGDPRSESKEALERMLRLSELLWLPIKHSQHVSIFEPYVARPDVAVVLLAIRWSSHSCTDVRHLCRKYAKPLVRLPTGYGPNQVATQLLNQCSWRLKRSRQRAS